MNRPDTPIGISSCWGMEDAAESIILGLHMSTSGIRTAALSLAILVIATEGAAIVTRLTGLGEQLEGLVSPSALVLGTVAGLAIACCRSARR